ncbi:MAG: 16S rRNA (cytosine(967)-C(5))-methyltransferase RsmB [Desulfobulbaceae bacterium]|nr:16S rRNA (cytosine(967)-C(5))-methyltransferase RsmB [Desulfobulbaceae bacterium]
MINYLFPVPKHLLHNYYNTFGHLPITMSKKKPSSPNARTAALKTLCQWAEQKKTISPIMDKLLEPLPANDRRLCGKLIMGTLRNMGQLDHIITGYSKHPLAKMKITTLMALRLAVFQLLFLDRIPPSAAVNETVLSLKAQRQPQWLLNFVNGVLRRISSEIDIIRAQKTIADDYDFNHPSWMVTRWNRYFGQQLSKEICLANNQEPKLCLRVNTKKISQIELQNIFIDSQIETKKGSFAPDALIIYSNIGSPTLLPGFKDSLFQVQGEAAQLASFLMGPFTGNKTYLDGCAGLGGKTSHLIQLIKNVSLTAIEPDSYRFKLLKENLTKTPNGNSVETVNLPLEEFANSTSKQFDAILLDAPCSGTGVIGKHPEIRWNRQESDLKRYQSEQLKLLQVASSLLNEGGIIVYATCSLEPEENEEVIERFLTDAPQFITTPCHDYLPSKAKDLVDEKGFFRSNQGLGLEGFFAARLQKICTDREK